MLFLKLVVNLFGGASIGQVGRDTDHVAVVLVFQFGFQLLEGLVATSCNDQVTARSSVASGELFPDAAGGTRDQCGCFHLFDLSGSDECHWFARVTQWNSIGVEPAKSITIERVTADCCEALAAIFNSPC